MINTYTGILIGGVIPAIIFGTAGIFVKASTKCGISPNYYLLFAGIGVLCLSAISFLFLKDQIVNVRSAAAATTLGFLWAAGTALMAVGVMRFAVPISVAAAIAGTNSLVTVLLGFLIFAEWRDVNIYKLIIGVILIVAGSILVAQSK